MARNKIDGVIEAVRYAPNGKIECVRAYERRGAVWSDRILLVRDELVERLKKGKRFVSGERKNYLGSTFETGPAVSNLDDHLVTSQQEARRDLLTGVPTF